MRVLTYEVKDAAGSAPDPDWTEVLFDRVYKVFKQVGELHAPVKVWESDKEYTLICKSCALSAYPCETVKLLGVDWKGESS